MKRKLFILGTLGLAGLFAGGVVAAYTITDNAEKQGIKITPGTITDDETGNVTLSWGDMTNFKNISGLSSSAPVTKSVTVKAAFAGEEQSETKSVYLGKLDVELKDLSGKASTDNRLIDHLHVVINGYKYANNAFETDKSKLGEIPTEGVGAFATSIGVYADANGKQVDFVVSLDSVDATVMSQIVTDQVYLSVDWNRGGNESDAKRVYIPAVSGWGSDMYVYSYSNEGSIQNAAFPGVKCSVDAETGLFVADLLPHQFFVFSDGTNQYPATGGMSAESLAYSNANAIYFNWTSHTFENTAPVQLEDFYLLGEVNEWVASAEWAFVDATASIEDDRVDQQWKIEFSAQTGKRYKVRTGDGSFWLGYDWIEEGARGLVNKTNDDGDFDFNAAGNYEIYLKHWAGSGYSMWIAAKA